MLWAFEVLGVRFCVLFSVVYIFWKRTVCPLTIYKFCLSKKELLFQVWQISFGVYTFSPIFFNCIDYYCCTFLYLQYCSCGWCFFLKPCPHPTAWIETSDNCVGIPIQPVGKHNLRNGLSKPEISGCCAISQTKLSLPGTSQWMIAWTQYIYTYL